MAPTSEEAFVSTLDAAQDYLALQESLGAALRSGFLSLAQARYSMGADRVSALQYPSHMRATARLLGAAAGGGDLELAVAEAEQVGGSAASSSSSSNSSLSATGPGAPDAAGAAGHAAAEGTSSTAAASKGVEEQLQELRLAAQQNDSIVQQLAAKYGCGGGAGSLEDDGYEEVTRPHKPLNWFGSLVAPSLRDAEGHFGRALALVVQAANAQRRLRQGLDSY